MLQPPPPKPSMLTVNDKTRNPDASPSECSLFISCMHGDSAHRFGQLS